MRARGGNAAGAALKDKSLGATGNSIAGAIGGVIVAQIVQRLTGVDVTPGAAAAVTSGLAEQIKAARPLRDS